MPATPAWPPRSAPRLFVSPHLAAGERLILDGPHGHYLAKVMRVTKGDAVVLCDDATGEWAASVVEAGRKAVVVEIAERLRQRENVPDFWLCPALLKRDRFEQILEKATELGVRAIHPLLTRRCVADKFKPERGQAILIEAAEQCARTALPELGPVTKLDALLRGWPNERALFFADEQGGEPAVRAFAAHRGPAALLTGPEGGFDDAERAAIRALPRAVPITLGPRILRGETAAIAGIAAWMATAGDWRTE